jgi:hypothetical protein
MIWNAQLRCSINLHLRFRCQLVVVDRYHIFFNRSVMWSFIKSFLQAQGNFSMFEKCSSDIWAGARKGVLSGAGFLLPKISIQFLGYFVDIIGVFSFVDRFYFSIYFQRSICRCLGDSQPPTAPTLRRRCFRRRRTLGVASGRLLFVRHWMSTYFSTRLPSNHGVAGFCKGAAITFLRANALAAPTFLLGGQAWVNFDLKLISLLMVNYFTHSIMFSKLFADYLNSCVSVLQSVTINE